MSNKKQNSIDWYSNEIGKITALALSGKMSGLEWKYLQAKALEKAKGMHKEEIVNAVDGFPIHLRHMDGKDYYNETFNNHETN